MRYGILCFMVVFTVFVFSYTIHGLARGDFSASGMRITRKESPLGFWFTGACNLAACGIVTFFLIEAIKKALE